MSDFSRMMELAMAASEKEAREALGTAVLVEQKTAAPKVPGPPAAPEHAPAAPRDRR